MAMRNPCGHHAPSMRNGCTISAVAVHHRVRFHRTLGAEYSFYAFAEKALAIPEIKGLLMEAVNEHNRAEQKERCWVSHYIIFM